MINLIEKLLSAFIVLNDPESLRIVTKSVICVKKLHHNFSGVDSRARNNFGQLKIT